MAVAAWPPFSSPSEISALTLMPTDARNARSKRWWETVCFQRVQQTLHGDRDREQGGDPRDMCASRPWLRQLAPVGRERKGAQGVASRTNLVGSAVGGRRRAV